MSVVEDSRKLLQDFVAPELRAIDVRLTALEKRFEGIDKRFDQVTFEIRRLTDFHEMELRVARIESEFKKRNLASGDSTSEAA